MKRVASLNECLPVWYGLSAWGWQYMNVSLCFNLHSPYVHTGRSYSHRYLHLLCLFWSLLESSQSCLHNALIWQPPPNHVAYAPATKHMERSQSNNSNSQTLAMFWKIKCSCPFVIEKIGLTSQFYIQAWLIFPMNYSIITKIYKYMLLDNRPFQTEPFRYYPKRTNQDPSELRAPWRWSSAQHHTFRGV